MPRPLLVLFLFLGFSAMAQTGTYSDPYFFKSDTTYQIPAIINQTNSYPPGADTGCLYLRRNAIFGYLKICSQGYFDINMEGTNQFGSPIDIDFIVFGPLNDPLDTAQFVTNNIADCSSTSLSTEEAQFNANIIGTYYVISILNYSNEAGTITLSEAYGAGISDSSCVPTNCAPPVFYQHPCEVTSNATGNYWVISFDRDTSFGHFTCVVQKEYGNPVQILSIDTILPWEPATYTDYSTSAQLGAVSYRIRAIDSCGFWHDSPFHYPLFLESVFDAGSNTNTLSWSDYIGFSYPMYYIYRGTTWNALGLIDSVPFGTNTYLDVNPPPGNFFYRIAVVSSNACSASGDSVLTHSNTAQSVFSDVDSDLFRVETLHFFPNPSSGEITLQPLSSGQLQIFDISGRLLRTETLPTGTSQLALEDLQDGLYVLRFTQDGNTCTKTLMLQH